MSEPTKPRPTWVFGEQLRLDDPKWHHVYVGESGNEDQAGMLFLSIDDVADEGWASAALSFDEATLLRDYLTRWIDWAGPYLEDVKRKRAA